MGPAHHGVRLHPRGIAPGHGVNGGIDFPLLPQPLLRDAKPAIHLMNQVIHVHNGRLEQAMLKGRILIGMQRKKRTQAARKQPQPRPPGTHPGQHRAKVCNAFPHIAAFRAVRPLAMAGQVKADRLPPMGGRQGGKVLRVLLPGLLTMHIHKRPVAILAPYQTGHAAKAHMLLFHPSFSLKQ